MSEQDTTENEITWEDAKALAIQIAATLGETERPTRRSITRMVKHLGAERVQGYVEQAQQIEAHGGLFYGGEEEPKRRTLGGVFFYQARIDTDKKLWRKHIDLYGRGNKQTQSYSPYKWEERVEDVKEFKPNQKGVATVEIKLVGTPSKVLDKGAVMLLVMVGKQPNSLPKGLPTLPEGYQPVYLAMIAKKQWAKVADQVKAGERLMLTGYPVYDEKLKRITVLVQSTQTIPPKKKKEEA